MRLVCVCIFVLMYIINIIITKALSKMNNNFGTFKTMVVPIVMINCSASVRMFNK